MTPIKLLEEMEEYLGDICIASERIAKSNHNFLTSKEVLQELSTTRVEKLNCSL